MRKLLPKAIRRQEPPLDRFDFDLHVGAVGEAVATLYVKAAERRSVVARISRHRIEEAFDRGDAAGIVTRLRNVHVVADGSPSDYRGERDPAHP